MTHDKARIILLESALRQAQCTVEFLHHCLIPPAGLNYSYQYPEQTIDRLKEWEKLAPRSELICFHSMRKPDCPACQNSMAEMQLYYEALEALKIPLDLSS